MSAMESSKKSNTYAQTYWVLNRERLLARKAERYRNDPEYRANMLARAKERSDKLRAQKPVVEKTVPSSAKERSRKLRPHMLTQADGTVAALQHIKTLAKRCKASPHTIRDWEKKGVIPLPTMMDEADHRWYSPAYVNLLAGLAELHWTSVKDLDAFKILVMKAFENASVK